MIPNLPELKGLETAEAFLDHFAVAYDRDRLKPLRVPLLRRFHRYLAATLPAAEEADAERARVRDCLMRAYRDVVEGAEAAPRAAVVVSQGSRTFIPLAALAPIADRR
jgi:hypothetical protein